MQARPGSMFELPRVPPVQVDWLVQVGAAPSGAGGGGGPASGTPPSLVQLPAGMPAFTHAANAVTSGAGTAAFGAGGIGEAVDCIRTTARAPLVCVGYPGAGPWRAASVASDWGAPPAGVAP